ncbi:hypothetical protein FJZ33_07585 [Candidatus Poribacteria bacterium]|nr:hypothetical protein [Candidatus Poribacteria bacterium]
MNINWQIIHNHEQKFKYSCIPSAIEMVLKLLKKVGEGFYDFQEQWRDKQNGSFDDFHNYKYKGVTFYKHYDNATNLLRLTDRELNSRECIIISLRNANVFHMWIIYDKKGNNYLNFSKVPQLRFEVAPQLSVVK